MRDAAILGRRVCRFRGCASRLCLPGFGVCGRDAMLELECSL